MKALTFSDVLIKPAYSEVRSRNDVKLNTRLSDTLECQMPIVASNMKHIIGPKMVKALDDFGAFSILHRFHATPMKQRLDYQECVKAGIKVGVSVGVKDEAKKEVEHLAAVGAKIFCIDIAHGHHILMKEMIAFIKNNVKDSIVIGGNVATKYAALSLVEWGADVVKVGIGPGSVCTTRLNTGVGVPQLSAIQEVKEGFINYNVTNPIISDGGIKFVGDIAKALKYADMVMLGNMLSGHSEVPSDFYQRYNAEREETEWYTIYGGSSASETKGNSAFSEGLIKTVTLKGKVKYQLRKIQHGVKSAFSYVGANTLKEFQTRCEFIEIGSGGASESKL